MARTWQYARRQRTWLRREPGVVWLDAEQLGAVQAATGIEQVAKLFLGELP